MYLPMTINIIIKKCILFNICYFIRLNVFFKSIKIKNVKLN